MKKRKKRAVTLIEIMIVILLIGLIGGALAFNMRGSMDQGKAFKSRQNRARAMDALMLKSAETGKSLEELIKNKKTIEAALQDTPFAKKPAELMKDGWGQDFTFSVDANGELQVTSQKLDKYDSEHSTQ